MHENKNIYILMRNITIVEWSAFAGELEITSSIYENKKLKEYYWSSTQHYLYSVWSIGFSSDYVNGINIDANYYVRLGTTF